MTLNLGYRPEDSSVYVPLGTFDGSGGSVAPNSAYEAADFRIYKNASATQKATTNGITVSSPFDSITGGHYLTIDTSNDTGDSGFWEVGAHYAVWLVADETVDSQTVNAPIAVFDIGPIQANATNVTSGSGGISVVASSFTKTVGGTETNTYTSTAALDGTYHIVPQSGGNTDAYYEFSLPGNGVPQSVTWKGYAQSINDSYAIYFYNWVTTSWDQVGTIDGATGTALIEPNPYDATVEHVGTGVNLGKVRWRFYSTDGTNFATDRVICTYSVVNQAVGFINGSVWIDTVNGEAGTGDEVGTLSRPSSNIEDAKTIADNNNIRSFQFLPGSQETLSEDMSHGYEFRGYDYDLGLGGQAIDGCKFSDAEITGTGTWSGSESGSSSGSGASSGVRPEFVRCNFGSVSIPPCKAIECGFGLNLGTFSSGITSGEYIFVRCYSIVPGSGSPALNFNSANDTMGINNRGWHGGATYSLNSNCTLSHEGVGGGITVTTGGANVEIRGIHRSLFFTFSASETVQCVGVFGPITLQGTATAAIFNLYGISSAVTDSAATNVTATCEALKEEQLFDTAAAATAASNFWGTGITVGTATAGGVASITLDSEAVGANGYYDDAAIMIVDGTGKGQTRQITTYVMPGRLANVDSNWTTQPDTTSKYQIMGRLV